MFNILPDNLKKEIKTEYFLRLAALIFLAILFIQISFLIFLLPSWILSVIKEKDITLQAETVNDASLNADVKTVNSTIGSINYELETINSTMQYPAVVPLIDEILSRKTKNVSIKEITYTFAGKTQGKISISGIGATRESLVLFSEMLEDSKLFEKVDLPISNFTKDKNINFSMSMIMEQ